MRFYEVLVLALGFIGGCAYAASYRLKGKMVAIVIKGIASSLFVLLGALCCLRQFDRYSIVTLIALFLGAAADVVFGLRHVHKEQKNTYFKYGVGLFALGHIAYIVALCGLARPPVYVFFIAAALGLVICAVPKFFFKAHYGRLGAVIVVYAAILASMMLCAVNFAVVTPLSINKILVGCAAVLFTVSDIVLLVETFLKDNCALSWVNLVSYYSGQLLFALSIGFVVR